MDWIKAVIDESGDYEFRVKSNPRNSDLYESSDWTEASAVKTYVRPETALVAPAPYWDENEHGVIHFKAVGETSFYLTHVFSIDENGNERRCGGYIFDLQPDENGICTLDVSQKTQNDGKYCVKVKAVSKDITKVANSDWSESSDILSVGLIIDGGENEDTQNKPTDNKPTDDKPSDNNKPSDNKEGQLVLENGELLYYENGVIDTQMNGFVTYEGTNFLVANGKVATSINGLAQDPQNLSDWYFCAGGAVQNHTGLVGYDGAWFYVDNGRLDTTVTGYVAYDTGLFYVGLGRIMTEVNGLAQDTATGAWYYLANGQVQNQYTGLAMYDNAWFYVVNGVLASDYTGNVEYDGAVFYVQNGMLK